MALFFSSLFCNTDDASPELASRVLTEPTAARVISTVVPTLPDIVVQDSLSDFLDEALRFPESAELSQLRDKYLNGE